MREVSVKPIPDHWREFVRMRRRCWIGIVCYLPVCMCVTLLFPHQAVTPILLLWFVWVNYFIYASRKRLLSVSCPQCGNTFFGGNTGATISNGSALFAAFGDQFDAFKRPGTVRVFASIATCVWY